MVDYREILDFDGAYCVGSDGSVWSQRSGSWKRLVPHPVSKTNRYLAVCLSKGGVRRTQMVHRLVLTCFQGPCPLGLEGCHEDGNLENNSLSNLRWDTHQSNHKDRVQHGTNNAGESNGRALLTESDVHQIKSMTGSSAEIARQFGVHRVTVSDIRRGKTWKNVA